MMLERHCTKEWLVQKSEYLYHAGLSIGLEHQYGGIFYLISPNGTILDADKYYWVMTEAIGASSLLAVKITSAYYWNIYDSIFTFCWTFFVDKIYGGWYQLLNWENQKYSNIKSPPPKTDYHPVANCYETIRALTQYIK